MIDKWPAAMRGLFDAGDAASSLGGGISVECAWPQRAGVKPTMAMHAFYALLPVLLAFVVAFASAVHHVARWSSSAADIP